MVCDGITGGSNIIQKAKSYLSKMPKGVKFAAKAIPAIYISANLGVPAKAAAATLTTAEAIKLLNEQENPQKPLQQTGIKTVAQAGARAAANAENEPQGVAVAQAVVNTGKVADVVKPQGAKTGDNK